MAPKLLSILNTTALILSQLTAAVQGEYTVDILIENHENLFVMSNGSNKKYIQLSPGQYTK